MIAVALLLALSAGGCAATTAPDLSTFALHSAGNSFEVLHRRVNAPDALALPLVQDRQTSAASCGAHALASVVNYWRGPGTSIGDDIFRTTPPADAARGYTMAELIGLAEQRGLRAAGVRLDQAGLVAELESGRPVLIPVRVPEIYVDSLTLPGERIPVLGLARNLLVERTARLSEWTGRAMLDHYVLVAGHSGSQFVLLDPVLGFRTISATRLARYRAPFAGAAIVFSAQPAERLAAR
jgi:predicted double-glycine peptidase